MRVAKDAVVSIDYTLIDDAGSVIDSSQGRAPLAYVHGRGQLVPGLEAALAGRVSGDQVTVTVPPAEGYGERDSGLVVAATRAQFTGVDHLEVGMQFQASEDGGPKLLTIVAIEGDTVRLDANHPLAGMALTFDVRIVGVRAATPEELAHGHVHDGDDHHH